jgi:hypothetical protein
MTQPKLHFETLQLHAGQEVDPTIGIRSGTICLAGISKY